MRGGNTAHYKNMEKGIPQKASFHHLFTANVYDGGCKRLRERMQTFAVKRGSALKGRMQCTARADAVHCGDGCSALRLRQAKQTPKSPVLFWVREKEEKAHHTRGTIAPGNSCRTYNLCLLP